MVTHVVGFGIPGPRVADLAGVTYRQLDHWVRQGYVTPSVQTATGRGARRLFAPRDVVRVAALGRFGRARLDIALLGPLAGGLDLAGIDHQLVIAVLDPLTLETVHTGELRRVLASVGPCVLFDPAPVLARLNPPGLVDTIVGGRLRTVS